MKKTSDTAMFPIECENALLLLGKKIRMARVIQEMTQRHLAASTEISLNTVVKMEAGHPGVQIGFYLKALWALNLIDDFEANLRSLGINETQFLLVESNLPKVVRPRSKR